MATATLLALGTTWAGIGLAYDSYDWPPRGTGWPVSFFVVTLVLLVYLASAPIGARTGRSARRDTVAAAKAGV